MVKLKEHTMQIKSPKDDNMIYGKYNRQNQYLRDLRRKYKIQLLKPIQYELNLEQ